MIRSTARYIPDHQLYELKRNTGPTGNSKRDCDGTNKGFKRDKLQRPRREHKLPNVLSKEKVRAILSVPKNQKHSAMLSVINACGLRRSELLNLKPADIDNQRRLLIIRNTK